MWSVTPKLQTQKIVDINYIIGFNRMVYFLFKGNKNSIIAIGESISFFKYIMKVTYCIFDCCITLILLMKALSTVTHTKAERTAVDWYLYMHVFVISPLYVHCVYQQNITWFSLMKPFTHMYLCFISLYFGILFVRASEENSSQYHVPSKMGWNMIPGNI